MKIVKKESKAKSFETVEIRKPVVGDLVKAERVAGSTPGVTFMMALLSQISTFDGEKKTTEELEVELSMEDFLQLSQEFATLGLPEEQAKQLLRSSDTAE